MKSGRKMRKEERKKYIKGSENILEWKRNKKEDNKTRKEKEKTRKKEICRKIEKEQDAKHVLILLLLGDYGLPRLIDSNT
jgi:hypothetical protein